MASGNKVAALKYAVPGAGAGWYAVPGLGIFHTDIAVPVDEKAAKDFLKAHKDSVAAAKRAHEEFEDRAAAGEFGDAASRNGGRIPFGDAVAGKDGGIEYRDPPAPVELVHISEAKAAEGLAAQLEVRNKSRRVVAQALRGEVDEETVLAKNEAEALAATEEG